jgi:hypothetical protein
MKHCAGIFYHCNMTSASDVGKIHSIKLNVPNRRVIRQLLSHTQPVIGATKLANCAMTVGLQLITHRYQTAFQLSNVISDLMTDAALRREEVLGELDKLRAKIPVSNNLPATSQMIPTPVDDMTLDEMQAVLSRETLSRPKKEDKS